MSDLFKDFNPVDEKMWKSRVQAELKGADFAETLVSDTAEGFQIKPLYTHADAKKSTFNVQHNNWKIISKFIPGADISYSSVDGVWLHNQQLNEFKSAKEELLIVSYQHKLPVDSAPNNNSWLDWDFLGDLAESGNYPEKSHSKALETLQNMQSAGYNNSFSVNISRYQNAGANHAGQLALMLLSASEYMHLNDHKPLMKKMLVSTAIGGNFFFEIAKLRAIRILMTNLAKQSGQELKLKVLAESSLRNKSVMDKYNNIIRTTFEAAAAVMGNADFVSINPYDELFKKVKESSLETSFKQQLVLREESFLNMFTDPLKGSYYVEYLTEQLAIKAWDIFKNLEAEGGFIAGLKSEKIQKMIAASAKKEQEKFDAGIQTLIGVNKYPPKTDDFVKYGLKEPFQNKGQTLFRTITPGRLAEKSEAEYAEN